MDVDAYLRRIGYRGARAPVRAVLAELVLRHVQSIPFENIDAFVGRRISLDPADVERKLVHDTRGGWCFEQNLLLGEALRALGFEVTDLAGRVLWNRPPDAVTARTHRLLLVRTDGRDWLADAGFGGQTMSGILDLREEAAQPTAHEPFRLRCIGGEERIMESLVAGAWKPLCRFDLQPQLLIDFAAANYQLAHDPASPFTQGLVVSRVAPGGRHILRGRELVFHPVDGVTALRKLSGTGAVIDALRDVFGIALSQDLLDPLRRRLEATA